MGKIIKRVYWRDNRGTRLISQVIENAPRKKRNVNLDRMVELAESDDGANLLSAYLKGVAE